MKTIWTIIGVIVLIAIIIVFYKMATKQKPVVSMMPTSNGTGQRVISNNTTPVANPTNTTVIVPVVIKNPADCNQSYKDNVLLLFDTYKQKRIIYQNGLASNDPNTIQYHKDMNNAYNSYYDEAQKCNYFIG